MRLKEIELALRPEGNRGVHLEYRSDSWVGDAHEAKVHRAYALLRGGEEGAEFSSEEFQMCWPKRRLALRVRPTYMGNPFSENRYTPRMGGTAGFARCR